MTRLGYAYETNAKLMPKSLNNFQKQAVGFNVTPNDVLRKLLGLDIYSDMSKEPTISTSLLGFIHSKEFEAHSQAIDRYLNILSWLNTHHEEKFPNVILNFQRGGRRSLCGHRR